MNYLNILIEENFGEKIGGELQDVGKSFMEFFEMIKEMTYDPLCEAIGADVVNLLGIGIGIILVMVIATKVINR